MRLAGEGMDNAVKEGKMVRLKTVLETAYIEIDPNGKVCVVGVKHRMILTMNLC